MTVSMTLTKYELAKGAKYAEREKTVREDLIKSVYTTHVSASPYYIIRTTYRDGVVDTVKTTLGEFDAYRYEGSIDEWVNDVFVATVYLDSASRRYRLVVQGKTRRWYESSGHGDFGTAKSDLARWRLQHRLPEITVKVSTFEHTPIQTPANLLVPEFEPVVYQNAQSKYENTRIKSGGLSEGCLKKSNAIKEFIEFENLFRSTCMIEIKDAKDVIPIPPYQNTKKNEALNAIFGF